MNEIKQIVCFYAKHNGLVQQLLYVLNVFNLEVKYRNKHVIGFVHPKLGMFEIIFRDLCAANDNIYKYVLKGSKAIYVKCPVGRDENISKFKKEKDDYFYPCYHNGECLRLPVFVVNNFLEFVDAAFTEYKTLYYEPIFEDNLFTNEYKESYYSIIPPNVNAFETKEDAKEFALKKMKKDIEWYRTRIGNKKRAILSYQREIQEYEQEIEDLEKKISYIIGELDG